jgi:hypothetical protein
LVKERRRRRRGGKEIGAKEKYTLYKVHTP